MQKIVLTAALAAMAVVSALAFAAPAVAASTVNSDYLAGYQSTQVGISRATATVVAPTVTCDPTATQGVVFGVGNQPTADNLSLLAGVRVMCSSGTAQVFGYAFGTATHKVVLGSATPGDHFNITVAQTEKIVTITAADLTTGAKFRVSGTPSPDNTLTFGAFPLVSGVTALPVPDFGTVTIGHPVLENTALAAWSPTWINRHTGTATQIRTARFMPGGGFRLVYQSS